MKIYKAVAGLVLGASMMTASAGTLDISVDGVTSWDGEGSGNNTILIIALDAPATITGIGWDVEITTVGASWLSEADLSLGPVGGPAEVFVGPCATASPGVESCSSGGVLDLTDNGIPDIVLADGMLQIEFFESFDDVTDEIDAFWNGTLTIECDGECTGGMMVPEPGMLGLMGIGLVGAFFARRRLA